MEQIIAAQGAPATKAELGTLTSEVVAKKDGRIGQINCLRMSRLARMAGAPIDTGAGILLLKKLGDRVRAAEPVYRIFACEQSGFELAVGAAKVEPGYAIDG
jgi:thymidine phosphorylase